LGNTPFFCPPSKKTTLIFVFQQPFRGPDGVKVEKIASILGPLVGFGRDAFLPYFGKQSDI
jgi:hypothetical protein